MEPEDSNKPDWDITKGDYKLAEESRRSYNEKIRRKKFYVKLIWIIVYLVAVVIAAVFIFSN